MLSNFNAGSGGEIFRYFCFRLNCYRTNQEGDTQRDAMKDRSNNIQLFFVCFCSNISSGLFLLESKPNWPFKGKQRKKNSSFQSFRLDTHLMTSAKTFLAFQEMLITTSVLPACFFSSTYAPWTNWIKLSRRVLKRPLTHSLFEKRASLAWSILRSLELCSERSLLCASVKILAAKESFGHLLNETKTGNDSSARFTSTLYLGERLWLVCGLSCKSVNLAVTCIILTWAQVYVARIIL